MRQIRVIDSHTGGEPTRIIIEGGPQLGQGTLAERLVRFREQFDDIRRAVITEPRGSDVLVGGLLCSPCDSTCDTGVIFFNNSGYLNMCGHGTMGLAVTLAWMGRCGPGTLRIETPVGVVAATLKDQHRVVLQNLPAWRFRHDVTVEVPGHGPVTGDIAWGGNWFFLVSDHGQTLSLHRCPELTAFTRQIREALEDNGITGAGGGVIDHIELFGPAINPAADSRNFVLCPGGAYDRSPCGTGTSAKLACLAADGKLEPGKVWCQESIVGSLFEGQIQLTEIAVPGFDQPFPAVIPTVSGSAWVTGDARLLLDDSDPFRTGISLAGLT